MSHIFVETLCNCNGLHAVEPLPPPFGSVEPSTMAHEGARRLAIDVLPLPLLQVRTLAVEVSVHLSKTRELTARAVDTHSDWPLGPAPPRGWW